MAGTVAEFLGRFGIEVDKSSVNKAQSQISGLKSFAMKALGAIGIGFSLKAMNSLAEEFDGINDKVKSVTAELGNQKDIQDKIMQVANATRTSYSDMATTVTDLISRDSQLFGDIDTAVGFADSFTKSLKAAGATEGDLSTAQNIVNQSIEKGQMDSALFNRALQASPAIVRQLGQSLGKTKDELSKMAEAGQLSAQTLRDAYLSASSDINAKFGELDISVSDAVVVMRNEWSQFCSDLWQGSGITEGVGKLMIRTFRDVMEVLRKLQPTIERIVRFALNGIRNLISVCEKIGRFIGKIVTALGGASNALKLLMMILAPFFAFKIVSKIKSVISAVKMLASTLGIGILPLLKIIAIFVLLGLALDDFVNFMQGNDSLIGEFFKSQGIDAEDMKQKVIGAWENIKVALGATWEWLKSACKGAFEAVSSSIGSNGANITTILNGLQQAVAFLAKFWTTKLKMTVEIAISLLKPLMDFLINFLAFIANVFTGNWGAAWENIKGMLSAAIDFIKNLLSGIWTYWTTIFSMILEAVLGVLDSMFGGVSETFGNIVSTVTNKVTEVYEAITSGIQSAIDFLKGLPQQALQWGTDFIQGFINGITGMIGKVTETVSGIANKIKEFLHFSRPDTGPLRDYENWMPDMMQGLADGLQNSMPDFMSKVKDMTGQMSSMIQAGVADMNTQVSAMVGGYQKSISQIVNISNTFNGGTATAQTQGAKAMNRAAKTSTAYMANALAVGR